MSGVSYRLIIRQLAEQWQLSERQYQCLAELDASAAQELMKIDTTLKQMFANSPRLAEFWMTSPNKAFGGNSPMDLITQRGAEGLRDVVELLCLKR